VGATGIEKEEEEKKKKKKKKIRVVRGVGIESAPCENRISDRTRLERSGHVDLNLRML
jgi:hypothetical protein